MSCDLIIPLLGPLSASSLLSHSRKSCCSCDASRLRLLGAIFPTQQGIQTIAAFLCRAFTMATSEAAPHACRAMQMSKFSEYAPMSPHHVKTLSRHAVLARFSATSRARELRSIITTEHDGNSAATTSPTWPQPPHMSTILQHSPCLRFCRRTATLTTSTIATICARFFAPLPVGTPPPCPGSSDGGNTLNPSLRKRTGAVSPSVPLAPVSILTYSGTRSGTLISWRTIRSPSFG
mmetsp:Transcript_8345/g.25081  ORF Transcript_8345/g.25081 Transcript_8345/m.25081 type:complete len:235 (+) Transcript_8345:690-1394(+)